MFSDGINYSPKISVKSWRSKMRSARIYCAAINTIFRFIMDALFVFSLGRDFSGPDHLKSIKDWLRLQMTSTHVFTWQVVRWKGSRFLDFIWGNEEHILLKIFVEGFDRNASASLKSYLGFSNHFHEKTFRSSQWTGTLIIFFLNLI